MVGRPGKASVVRGEENQGILFHAKFAYRAHDLAHRIIHALDHGGVDGIALAFLLGNLLVALDLFLLALQRSVHGVKREIEKEGFLLSILLDQFDRSLGQDVGQVIALRAAGKGLLACPQFGRGDTPGSLEGMKKAPGSPVIVPAQVMVEPVVFGQGERSPAEVPFAGMKSRVSFLPQILRQGSFFQRKRTQKTTGPHLVTLGVPSSVGQPLSQHQARRVLAGQQGGPGGRTDHAS